MLTDPPPDLAQPVAEAAGGRTGWQRRWATRWRGSDLRGLLALPDLRRFLIARIAMTLAVSIQAATVGWQVAKIAGVDSALELGIVGLVQFLPLALMALPAGVVADRMNRRTLLLICLAIETVGGILFVSLALMEAPPLRAIDGVLVLYGTARAFAVPAMAAFLPALVPKHRLPNATALSSTSFQLAMIAGPAASGLLLIWGTAFAYAATTAMLLLALILMLRLETPIVAPPALPMRWSMMLEGLTFIWRRKLVLGAISLDLFAVLSAGATALLPIYASDILNAGPASYGWLRAAPALGAVVVAATLAARPIRRHVGAWMFGAVALFAVATFGFAFSTSLPLSMLMLAAVGATDMISVYVRQTLLQLATPDAVRGRVYAVMFVFLGASNELGEFESGVLAHYIGPVAAVAWGAVAALLVTGLWALMFPSLRRVDRLDEVHPDGAKAAA